MEEETKETLSSNAAEGCLPVPLVVFQEARKTKVKGGVGGL